MPRWLGKFDHENNIGDQLSCRVHLVQCKTKLGVDWGQKLSRHIVRLIKLRCVIVRLWLFGLGGSNFIVMRTVSTNAYCVVINDSVRHEYLLPRHFKALLLHLHYFMLSSILTNFFVVKMWRFLLSNTNYCFGWNTDRQKRVQTVYFINQSNIKFFISHAET